MNEQEQAAFLRSVDRVRTTAVRALRAHPGEVATIAFVRNLQRGVDRLLDDAQHAGRRIDCAAGCSHCCHARVEATAPEIFAIVDEIARRGEDERDAIAARLAAVGPQRAASWQSRAACPFLIDRLCSIYAVRPTACRKAHSIDVAACEAYAPTIPQDLQVALGAEALMHGTAQAYGELGFDATPRELVGAVLAALDDPSLRARWFARRPRASSSVL